MHNSKLLSEGIISAEEFLNRIVYRQAEDDFGLMDTEFLNIFLDEDDDEGQCEEELLVQEEVNVSQGSSSRSSSSQCSSKLGQCVVCQNEEPEICVLPCFEFCVCETCWNILQRNSQKNSAILKCPKCLSIATDGKKMQFVTRSD